MKLPHKDDPGGDKEGALRRADVLDTLFIYGISIEHLDDGDVNLISDENVLAVTLGDIVGGRMVRSIARAFNIDVTEFYRACKRGMH